MGQSAIVNLDFLDAVLILGPERYDPRRYRGAANLTVADVAEVAREQVYLGKGNDHLQYLILDTSDAREGIIMTNKGPVTNKELGSTKKIAREGDVIISRLRPYLHQVAYVDGELTALWSNDVVIACSTEFFVLHSRDERSIAFLVPYLLSAPIQEILCASQEGGHHPRFNQKTLETIPIPEQLVGNRDSISSETEGAIRSIREATLVMHSFRGECARIYKIWNVQT